MNKRPIICKTKYYLVRLGEKKTDKMTVLIWYGKHDTAKICSRCEILARDLEALDDPRLAKIIERARRGVYDDFKSEYEWPRAILAGDLSRLGYGALAIEARSGRWAAADWEADEWINSDEAQEIIDELIGMNGDWGLM